jgi:hypothetical protein
MAHKCGSARERDEVRGAARGGTSVPAGQVASGRHVRVGQRSRRASCGRHA